MIASLQSGWHATSRRSLVPNLKLGRSPECDAIAEFLDVGVAERGRLALAERIGATVAHRFTDGRSNRVADSPGSDPTPVPPTPTASP